ncbi:hypothetical protein ACRALDRAFT_2042136 [Sodiomyces alcalophilus JCM 7366]|uniref:uncharacterized protein n=1 Tax=Sodiomyces alcalophilus JCM 7366 TaxID=591952 RepID=UPI0039B4F0C5
MAPSNVEHTGTEPRDSTRNSTASRDDDDSYDLSAMTVADGFRPAWASDASDTPTCVPSRSPVSSDPVSSSEPSSSASNETPATSHSDRPSSIAKPPPTHDPLSLRYDGATAHLAPSHSARPPSASHEPPFSRPESPLPSSAGPSHPYQMYSRRTLSTSSTPMSERSYAGPQRPTHPYGLYPQTMVPLDSSQVNDIPVGFVGTPDNYQRRIGPDGEEASGLIGPLGHTEELPPYTRYPEEAYTRKAVVGEDTAHVPPPPTIPPPAAPEGTIPGAGGIGLATRNPEFESRDDLDAAQSRLSTRSVVSDASQHEINTAAAAYNEKQEQGKWQKRARKRFCGVVPYWALCLLAVAMVVMGIVLGAVIGTVFAGDKSENKKPDEDAIPMTTDPTVDTIPLQTVPADLPPLDVGAYILPPLVSSQAPTTCFSDVAQAQAWTCDIQFSMYSMTVSRLTGARPVSNHALHLVMNGSSTPDLFTWGAQSPTIIDPIHLQLVNDTSVPDRGPAWFGQVAYNKTVVIAEDRFPKVDSSPSRRKRGTWGFDTIHTSRMKGVIGADDGDRPWICTWPGTLLEVFIYPSHNNSFSEDSSASVSRTNTVTETITLPGIRATSLGQDDGEDDGEEEAEERVPSSTRTTSTAQSTATGSSRLAAPPYPKVMKIEESRISDDDSRAAVCRQVEIFDGGRSAMPVLNDRGEPVEVIILENQRLVAYRFEEVNKKRRWAGNDPLVRKDNDDDDDDDDDDQGDAVYSQLSECGCMWWFT